MKLEQILKEIKLLKRNLRSNKYVSGYNIPVYFGDELQPPSYVCAYEDIEKYIALIQKKIILAYRKK